MDPNKRPEDMERITTPELAHAFIDAERAVTLRRPSPDEDTSWHRHRRQ